MCYSPWKLTEFITRRARIITIFGAKSKFPCPICLIPKEHLHELAHIHWPERTKDSTKEVLERASRQQWDKDRKVILKEQSIRNIPVRMCSPPAWTCANASHSSEHIYRAFFKVFLGIQSFRCGSIACNTARRIWQAYLSVACRVPTCLIARGN